MTGLAVIGLFVAAGMLLRLTPVPTATSRILNQIALYVALPALILLKVPHLPFSKDTATIALVPWLMLFFSAAVILFLARRRGWSKAVTGTLLMTVPLGNTGFLGVPIVSALYGEEGLPYVIVYDQVGTLLILVSYCSLVMARYGENAQGIRFAGMVRKIFLFPPMLAFLLGLMLRDLVLPELAVRSLALVAATLTPLVMVAIGLQIKLRLRRAILPPFALGLAVKLLLAPLAVYGLCLLAGLKGPAYQVAILEAGMPPMITASALAVNARMDADLAVALAGLGLLFAFMTLPLVFLLIR